MKPMLYNMNRLVCILLFLIIAGPFCLAETVIMDSAVPFGADLRIISESSSEIMLEFTFGAVEIDSQEYDGRFWKTARIEGCGLTSESGAPELPQYSAWIRIPWQNPQLDVIESSQEVRQWGAVLPTPEPMMRALPKTLRRIPNRSIYERNRYYPSQTAVCEVTGQISRSGVALVSVTPVQVNSKTGNWRIYPRVQIRLTGTRRGNLDDLQFESATTNQLINSVARNPVDALDEFADDPRLLLVTNQQYVTALAPFIEWKTQSGIQVETIIYSNVASTAAGLKNHLLSRISSCAVPPEFLLIVGDVDQIPAFFGVSNSLTDHLYSTLNAGDYLPDISVGRIPCSTPAELSQWTSRLLAYERDGIIPEYFNATSYSSNVAQDPQHGQDVTNLFNASGLVVNQLQQPQTGTLPSLLNALNQNPLWAFYIGHGYSQAWSSVSPNLQITDLPQIEHTSSTIVVSVACATADLDFPGACIAEEWFDQSLNGGLLAYIGATESTAFFRSDTIGISALTGVFAQGIERLGPALDYGKLMCAESFPQAPGGLTEETIQQFVLLGDPSMRVYTQSPAPLTVTHASSLPIGSTSLPVTASLNGQALADVELCLSGGDVYSIARTGASGSVELSFNTDEPATLLLTATARNVIAYQSEIQLVPNDAPYVIVDRIDVLDNTGDHDGRADRGETCELQITLRNIGSEASSAGQLTITPSENDVVQFSTTSLTVPAIPATSAVVIGQTAQFTVSPDTPDGTAVSLEFAVNAATGSPTTSLETLELHAPEILYSHCTLSELTGDGDLNPEAGETLALDLYFTNAGSDRALPIALDFHTSPSYLQIYDTRVVTDTVAEGTDLSVRFLFDAMANTPRGYPFEFYVDLSGANIDSHSVWDSQRIGQVPVLLYELDQNPAQIDALESSLSALGIEYERVTVLPYNLFKYRSVWIFCGISPNAHALSQSDGSRLAAYLDGGGNCYWEGGDVWCYDSVTPLHAYFHVEGLSDGSSNAGPIEGEYGTAYQDYHFAYSGENNFIDQIGPQSGASVILRNDSETHPYAVCVTYAGATYRTIGSSIEIGLLDDAAFPSTRVHLIADLLAWFGIESQADIYPPEIRHLPLTDFSRHNVPIPVLADVQDAGGIASVSIRYSVNDGPEQFTQMNLVDGLYRGAIPGMPWNTTIRYRIEAADRATPANTGATDEYTFQVRYEPSYTMDLYTYYGFQKSIKPRIDQPKDASWAITANDHGHEVLELHGISSDDMITYTTQIIDGSMLSDIRLKFWNYLRSGAEDHGVIARVLGSRDGGKTFPYVVWHRVQESAPVLEEGIVISETLDWIEAGDDRIAFRFETNTGWYWRIGEMQLIGDIREELLPIKNLTVRPYQGGVKLFWNSIEKALSYRVYTSTVNSADAFLDYIEIPDTSYVDPESFTMDQRFYRIMALMRESQKFEDVSPRSNTIPATLGAADIRWNVRKNKLNR